MNIFHVGVDVTIYELGLPEQQLYVFQELCSISLPLTFADFRSMLEMTMNFIKFRVHTYYF
jgi:hypothetical protein